MADCTASGSALVPEFEEQEEDEAVNRITSLMEEVEVGDNEAVPATVEVQAAGTSATGEVDTLGDASSAEEADEGGDFTPRETIG